jgi:hypothetical protein
MESEHDRTKVAGLLAAFEVSGFDKKFPALIGYPVDGRIQLLSGTHRHRAAELCDVMLPVTLWLRSDVESSWGSFEEWSRIMRDVPVDELENWTREDVEKYRRRSKERSHLQPPTNPFLGAER